MSSDDQRGGLADDLAARSDDELADLLAARPDLASPPPQGVGVLANRALTAASISHVGDRLDLLGVAVLEQLLRSSSTPPGARFGSGALPDTVAAAAVVDALAGRAEADDITARLALLRRLAIVWGDDTTLRVGAHANAALPWTANHLTGPLVDYDPSQLQELLDGVDDRSRDLLNTLTRGPAIGRTRDAATGANPDSPVARLIVSGLLARVDEQTVELPPMVARILRGEPPLGGFDLREPPRQDSTDKSASTTRMSGKAFGAKAIDAAAGGEALELIRHATTLLETLGRTPAAVLRSGGLGVRELGRLAKVTGLERSRLALITEILGQAQLIDVGFPDPAPTATYAGDQVFAPTGAADGWLHQTRDKQWQTLLDAWLAVPRRPARVGEADADGGTVAALSITVTDGDLPVQRTTILRRLAAADLAAPVSTDTLLTALAWHHPRQLRRLNRGLVDEVLTEARQLGVVAHGALTSVGRAVVADGDREEVAAGVLSAMTAALPEPVDHFLTQADLTLTVPGPMTPELAEQVELVADLESGGAASVYRVTEASVRRALDAGRSSNELTSLFTTHSRTPVPQSLTYLISDVARRHGQLRVGIASSFIRCEDAATLAAVLRSEAAEHLALRALAPTVAVSPSEVREVLDALRGAGFAPAAEDSSGSLVDVRERGSRVTGSRPRRNTAAYRRPGAPSAEQIQTVVSRIRSADRANAAAQNLTDAGMVRGQSNNGRMPTSAGGGTEKSTALIQLALRAKRKLRVGYVDAHGTARWHVVLPQSLAAGQLTGSDDTNGESHSFSLHRITSLEMLDK